MRIDKTCFIGAGWFSSSSCCWFRNWTLAITVIDICSLIKFRLVLDSCSGHILFNSLVNLRFLVRAQKKQPSCNVPLYHGLRFLRLMVDLCGLEVEERGTQHGTIHRVEKKGTATRLFTPLTYFFAFRWYVVLFSLLLAAFRYIVLFSFVLEDW